MWLVNRKIKTMYLYKSKKVGLQTTFFKDIRPNGILPNLRFYNSLLKLRLGFSIYLGLYVWRVDFNYNKNAYLSKRYQHKKTEV